MFEIVDFMKNATTKFFTNAKVHLNSLNPIERPRMLLFYPERENNVNLYTLFLQIVVFPVETPQNHFIDK